MPIDPSRGVRSAGALRLAFALVAGVATVFGFAPFGLTSLPVLTLAMLAALWQGAASARTAAAAGYAFGLGLFGAGASWVFIALHTFGGMPGVLAAVGTAGFCAFLALYPAVAGWLAVRWTAPHSWPRAVASAAAWAVAEWARSVVFTGFPWLSLGYAALPGGAPSPLAAYAPVGGVFLVTLLTALAAAALAIATDALANANGRRIAAAAGTMVAIGVGGAALARVEWTSTRGAPVAVSLVQGNVTQDLKFDPEFRRTTFELYIADLSAKAAAVSSCSPRARSPSSRRKCRKRVLAALAGHDGGAQRRRARRSFHRVAAGGARRGAALLQQRGERRRRAPAALSQAPPRAVRRDDSARARRRLVHPQGAVDPDREPGRRATPTRRCSKSPASALPSTSVTRMRSAPTSAARPRDATLLVNVTNDAWYGRSLAALQHNQIAAMRALETGRPLVRATNTGITSAIGHDGREIARLPWFTRGILEVEITGRQGVTPYVRFGDALPVAIALVLFVAAIGLGRRASRAAA